MKLPLLLLWLCLPCLTYSQTAAIGKKINAVEYGLQTAHLIQGVKSPPMNIYTRMKYYRVPAVSIAVINQGSLEWAKAYGKMDLLQGITATKDTLFQSGSISQFVTAAGSLSLVRKGLLNLDENINEKLKGWKIPENEFTKEKKVTLREILSHSAGLSTPFFSGYKISDTIPLLNNILKGNPPANSPPITVQVIPGSQWNYSEGGYEILQQLIVDVTQEPFPKAMKNLVFDKAAMTRSSFELPLPHSLLPFAAVGYLSSGQNIEGYWNIYPELAAIGLWSTPSDLARFLIVIQQALNGKSEKLLTKSLANEMITPQFKNWGLGVEITGTGDALRLTQRGSNMGFKSLLIAYAHRGQGAVIMTNSDNGFDLIGEIMRSIAITYGWPDFHPVEKTVAKVKLELFNSMTGTYEPDPENPSAQPTFMIVKQGNHLAAAPGNGGPSMRLYPESETDFFVLENAEKFSFIKNDEGKFDKLIITFENSAQATFRKR